MAESSMSFPPISDDLNDRFVVKRPLGIDGSNPLFSSTSNRDPHRNFTWKASHIRAEVDWLS